MMLKDVKKRKSCQSCTKAKAKCSPFEDRIDICYRCQRLKKECIFEETTRKRGPKNRSRVKQLEQRVDTLIDLLANGQASTTGLTPTPNADFSAAANTEVPCMTPPESATDAERLSQNNDLLYNTPAQTPPLPFSSEESYITYDPVEAGLLDDHTADALLREYRDTCQSSFPFVIIPQSTKARDLRRSQPFLFHAILTATAYRYPGLQLTLATELREQIASRIIKHAHKNLELIQGLLIYTAWYHYYYDPIKQQLATMLNLCVAMVQDLNFCKNTQGAKRQLNMGGIAGRSHSLRSLAEKRAFLGTFYLVVCFSQAWRKRATLRHTRYMDQCCQQLVEYQEYPSDALITPLVQLSALMCRVNDYFSYDDIENTEVRGEAIVQLSTTNFENELARLTESIPPMLMAKNPTLQLSIRFVEIWIHECAVHGSLWNTPGGFSTARMSSSRLKALSQCLNAVQSYITTVVAIPQASIHHLGFPSWSAWCYATIIACKLVFLEEEQEQHAEVAETFTEVLRLVTDKSLFVEPRPCSLPVELASSIWDPISVAKQSGLLSLFHQMYDKMKFTLPQGPHPQKFDHCKMNPLSRIAYYQKNLLVRFTNQINDHIAKLTGVEKHKGSTGDAYAVVSRENWVAQQSDYTRERNARAQMPLMQNLNFNSINFESIAPPETSDGAFSDWLWNTAIDDFTMPPM